MGERRQGLGKILLPIGLSIILIVPLVACSRDNATISSFDVKPLVCATFGAEVGPTLSEGVVVAIQSGSFEKDSIYEVAVISPYSTYRWERSVQPFPVGDLLYVGMNDLLLPSDLKLQQGKWNVEVFSKDGSRLSEEFDFARPQTAMTKAHLAVSIVDEMEWLVLDDGPQLRGLGTEDGPKWLYRFYDPDGNLLTVLESTGGQIQSPVFVDMTLQKRTHLITAMRYDVESGVYLMVRQFFT